MTLPTKINTKLEHIFKINYLSQIVFLLLFFYLNTAFAYDYQVTTLAGSGSNYGEIDGTGSSARFQSPIAICADNAGNLYVADYGGGTVRNIVISSGVVTTIAGTAGDLSVLDGNRTVARLGRPTGIATDNVNVYVSDEVNRVIRKIVISSGVVTTIKTFPSDAPEGLAYDPAGYLYVATSTAIYKLDLNGATVNTYTGSFGGIQGLHVELDALGNATNLYASLWSGGGDVRKINLTTYSNVSLGAPGIIDAFPYHGIIYAATFSNNTIRAIVQSPFSNNLIAGDSTPGTTDGIGTVARFSRPNCITSDGTNHLYVADYGNHTIRTITIPSTPVVTSISPASSYIYGGVTLTLTGSGFTGATSISIGGTTATSINVVNDNSVTCVAPAHLFGAASVVVTATGGSNSDNTLFTYIQPAPVVSSISPANALTTGGSNVTIFGDNFTGATGVTIGGISATSVIVVSNTTITATTPAHSAGIASVVVSIPGATGGADIFRYYTPPSVSSALTASATVGSVFTYTITGSGGSGSYLTNSFTATPLPAGLTINSSTGVISGTPTTYGITNVTIAFQDALGFPVSSATLVLTINGQYTDSAGHVYTYSDSTHLTDTSGNTYTYTDSGAYATITGFTYAASPAIIPASVPNGHPVTSIGNNAFAGSAIRNVIIPSSVTSIGTAAFNSCASLLSVDIPSSVTSIGDSAFQYCSSMGSVNIPSSVTSIGNYSFYNCTNLSSVTIPSSVTSIGDGAFSNCTNLSSVTIPSSVTSIAVLAFNGCTNLSSVTIPSSVTSIGEFAFYNCTNLSSVTNMSGVTSIGEFAFYNCTNLSSVTIQSGVTSIADYAFYNCTSLSSVIFNESYAPTIVSTSFDSISSGAIGYYPYGATGYTSAPFSTNVTGKLTMVSLPNPTPPKIAAGISISNTTQTYTGKPISVTTSLSPSTLSAAVVYYPGFNVPTDAGTYYVLVNVVDNTYYGSQSSVLTILPAAQTVSVVTPSSLRVGVPTTLLATSTSNGPISYSVVSGNATVSGSTLIAKDTNPIVIQANQAGTNDYQASSVTATIAASAYSPVAITSNPTNQLVRSGSSATFTVNASGTSPTYQWNLNGTPIAGATSASYTVTASSSATGNYTCTISNDAGSVTTPAATLTLNTTHLQNLSARSIVVTSNLSVGFVSTGASSKSILLRGDGPSLANYGVTGVLANPVLTLYNSSGSSLASNSTWGGASSLSSIFTQVGAFPLSATSNDAVLNQSLSSGTYSAIVTGANSSTGAAMVEIYDADPTGATSRLVNISARGMVGTGSSIMTGGFVISGNSTETVLIRAVGPTLSTYGVTGVLAQPTLTVYNASGTSVATNTIWGGGSTLSSAMTQVGAFALPATSADSAVLVTLPAGAYTVQVSGVNGTTGNALVEIYEVSSP